jgi:hypothetical protein
VWRGSELHLARLLRGDHGRCRVAAARAALRMVRWSGWEGVVKREGVAAGVPFIGRGGGQANLPRPTGDGVASTRGRRSVSEGVEVLGEGNEVGLVKMRRWRETEAPGALSRTGGC